MDAENGLLAKYYQHLPFPLLKEGVDYDVTYMNNIYKGKASIVITGTNKKNSDGQAFVGGKSFNFRIKAYSLKNLVNSIIK